MKPQIFSRRTQNAHSALRQICDEFCVAIPALMNFIIFGIKTALSYSHKQNKISVLPIHLANLRENSYIIEFGITLLGCLLTMFAFNLIH